MAGDVASMLNAGLRPLWDGGRIVAWMTERDADRNLVRHLARVMGRKAALRYVARCSLARRARRKAMASMMSAQYG